MRDLWWPGPLVAQASHFDVKTPLAGEPLTPMPPIDGTFWQHCRQVCARKPGLAILPKAILGGERWTSDSVAKNPFPASISEQHWYLGK